MGKNNKEKIIENYSSWKVPFLAKIWRKEWQLGVLKYATDKSTHLKMQIAYHN